jgi:hypothetical protein
VPKRGAHDTEVVVDVDLVEAEREDAAYDDITVVTTGPPQPRHRRRLLVAAAASALVVAAGGLAYAAGRDEGDSGPVRTAAGDDAVPRATSSAGEQAPVARPSTPPPTQEPAAPVTPLVVVPPAPETVAPPTASTLPAAAVLSASAEPAAVTVAAGTDVVVTLRVVNSGGAAGSYVYDDDSCDPAIVPSPARTCAQVTRAFDVPAGATVTHQLSVDTQGAPPGLHVVRVGTLEVRVTIT